ncbi:hypothetical protein AB595_21710 [Massilia sp. WF1]|uniref:hypothetical protein n=1 Tax=unclassified Massilia TaxID=2609279 RepID=UPI0006493BE4|nr:MULTISPECIES: hypothetical protein [unclassified Massilia]ALK97002.1 hypothetical protein AM586_12790 [Massilia sp. WG5]KLU34716.1 hypothetical protein AB595_21710 [Massilia sp. WF1]
MKITVKRYAFLHKNSTVTPEQLQTEQGVAQLSLFAYRDGWEAFGYTFVGEVEAAIELPDMRGLVENKIAALKEEAANLRAETTKKCTEIESQIQNLLAIEYTPAPEAAEQQ